jgi:hypothetical protein
MPSVVDSRREAARAFFTFLEHQLRSDEVLADRQCVRRLIDKEQNEHAAQSPKRFDAEECFRRKLLYGGIDDAIAAWCRARAIRTDPYSVFRFAGSERGPTQHETAIGPSLAFVRRAFERLAEAVPEVPDCSAAVIKQPTRTIAPVFRLQHPLPFGAAGEVKYAAARSDVERGIFQVAMDAATGGDPSRGWRYDCGVYIGYGVESPRKLIGDDLFAAWPEVHARIWNSGRVWVILL